MNDTENIIGVIYALPESVAKSIFLKKKDIFIKYLPHEPTKKTKIKIKKGDKVYIYISNKNKSVGGEAEIKKIEYLDAREILKKYSNRLMISKEDLGKYSTGRKLKKAQVLEICNIRQYPKEMRVLIPITMQGFYVTDKNKSIIFEGKK
jgi:hypothetical protein